jgi:hypothetical protein
MITTDPCDDKIFARRCNRLIKVRVSVLMYIDMNFDFVEVFVEIKNEIVSGADVFGMN